MQWSSEWGFSDSHLNSLTDLGNGSWPKSLEDSCADYVHRRGNVSLLLQAGLTSLCLSLKSFHFLGHRRGRKTSLPRTASLPQCRLWSRDTAGLVLVLGPLSNWETTTMLTKGESCRLWNCWDHHKPEIPGASKIAVCHKLSLLLLPAFVISSTSWFLTLTALTTFCPQ